MTGQAIAKEQLDWQGEQLAEILILDDSDFDRKRLRRSLSQLPMALNFTEAEDLYSFRQQIRHKVYDLVLIDYSLADGDGLQAIHAYKTSRHNRSAFFVMVTGHDSATLAVNALKSGFDDFLCKDDIHKHVLASLLHASSEKKISAKNVVDFPFSRISEHVEEEFPAFDYATPPNLNEVLEHPLRMAVQRALTQYRGEDVSDSAAEVYGLFSEEDEFVFRNTVRDC